ncbi:bifunctional folylpolyglutamate synthase/dihydrofolate synthase [Alphaproteobacteria bacterium]|nr:bifunctional folylpolyglutamate synthase/dihydrofolate synthase [Alphaproteobacteria bacterium]
MNYNEIVNYIENKKKFHRPDGLRTVFELFDFEIDSSKVIIVAGTNGKGTTCAVLQTLLHEAGKNVGFFSSPHLEKINERIKYNCVDVSDEEFCDLFFKVHEVVQDYDLSFFEYLTFMAVYHFFVFHKNDIDFAIFEVGLGGTLDSTNIIPHNTSVIAALDMDHTHVLGNSLLDIAANKFGIISENNTVFHLKFTDKIEELAYTYIAEKSARFIEAYNCSMRVDTSGKYPQFFIYTPFGEFKLPLPGMRAMENTALAITVFYNLVENAEKYIYAIEKTYWPGRMEKVRAARAFSALPKVTNADFGSTGSRHRFAPTTQVSSARTIYISGDHNVQGIDSLLALLPYYMVHREDGANITLVVGIGKDKDHDSMLQKLMDFPGAKLYLTETPIKTLKIQEYSKRFLEAATYVNANPQKTLEAAIANAAENELIVVTGSIYLVGLIRSLCRPT